MFKRYMIFLLVVMAILILTAVLFYSHMSFDIKDSRAINEECNELISNDQMRESEYLFKCSNSFGEILDEEVLTDNDRAFLQFKNSKAVYGMALGAATTWFFLIILNLIGRWFWKGKEKKQNYVPLSPHRTGKRKPGSKKGTP